MAHARGWPIWYELMTTDPAGAREFYGAVVGWDIAAQGQAVPSGADYRMIGRSDGGSAGGLLAMTPEMVAGGAKPGWLPYFHVGDVDATLAQARQLGAQVLMDQAMPVGRMALLADPQGAAFYVMTPIPPPDQPDAQSDVWAMNELQRCAWNELNTSDAPGAIAFYGALFGWTLENAMPMPGDNIYRFIDSDGAGLGAISSMMAPGYSPGWLCYFRVADIAAAHGAVEANGGTLVHGPHEVPGGDRIIVARDPAGAWVGFVAGKGEAV